MAVIPILDVLWHLIVIFTVLFILFYLFIVIRCFKKMKFQQSYDDYCETLEFNPLKTKGSIDSVFFVFKDDPEICAALNTNIRKDLNISVESLFDLTTSKINKKYLKKKSKCHSKCLTINSSNDMISTRTLCYPNHTLSSITNNNKKEDNNVYSTVNLFQSTYPLLRDDSTNDLLKIGFHFQPSVHMNKVLKMNSCIVNKNTSSHSPNNSINTDLEQSYNSNFCTLHESLLEYNMNNHNIKK